MTMRQFASVACAVAASLLLPLAAHARAYKLLHSFGVGTDGAVPGRGDLLNVNGTLYGTTYQGGTANNGTIFKIDPASGAETVLYSFSGGSDGDGPLSGLLNDNGIIYGTTSGTLVGDNGTVFKFDLFSHTATTVYAFNKTNDGFAPEAGLIKAGKYLYGTTFAGGTCNEGTVFRINPATGAEAVIHSFCGTPDGASPGAALLDAGGILYGTTFYGGSANQGTVFSIDPRTGREAVLHSFAGGGIDGGEPTASLIDVAGTLYGTAYTGGPSSQGALFSINPSTGAEKILYFFDGGANGGRPVATLLGIKGVLYGSTDAGGASTIGTIFKFDPSAGTPTVLHDFKTPTGAKPAGALVKFGKCLYGTTQFGGAANQGTVFSLKP